MLLLYLFRQHGAVLPRVWLGSIDEIDVMLHIWMPRARADRIGNGAVHLHIARVVKNLTPK